ncbi:cilia- and flagella-associated protein 107 isoform X2 [Eublepharis macularius]|uniref:Cilia- and flagella-associated protein 107 isoform X2 n=1 Tax=Eublepharis macularius TaxID=481883 RepID=A0AA97LJI6_EUBMA|nr:cilia- and flagella-associated protein 107 isoform X2 [Eublepharis macularius]
MVGRNFIQHPEKTCKSIYGRDYVRFPPEIPDRTVIRKNKKKLDGLPKHVLLTHHNEPHHRHLVTQYDDHFSRQGYNPLLPPLRKWNRHKMAWTPEKTDFPLAEPPTNYGLLEHLMRKWSNKDPPGMNSIYTISYMKPPVSAYAVHSHPFTTRLHNSSHEHLRPRTMDGYL